MEKHFKTINLNVITAHEKERGFVLEQKKFIDKICKTSKL